MFLLFLQPFGMLLLALAGIEARSDQISTGIVTKSGMV